jgi:hypothetical protein
MGAEGWGEVQKQRDFQAELVFSQFGGGHREVKNASSHEKNALAMGKPPANDPDFG